MKILYFTQLFYPAVFGGGEYIFYQWAKELIKKGHKVFVITQSIESSSPHETIDGIEIFRVGSLLHLGGTLPSGLAENLSFLIKAFFKGLQVAKEHQVDIIHSNTYIPVFAAQWCATRLKIPHIATVHDVYYTSKANFWKAWSNQAGISKLSRILGPLIEKKIAHSSVTLFHTVSEKSKSDLQVMGASKKIVVIPNGIDPLQYQTDTEKSKPQAIFVGRLVFYKNLDVVLEAFSKVIKKIPDARLVIVGEGPIKQSLVEKSKHLFIQDSVTFTGNISDQEKIRLISESRLLLNPSLVEGFGIVLLEGFACGKPVIVSDTKPLSDLVNDSIDGFVVSPFDSEQWANRIIELLSNPDKAQEMGKIGKSKAVTNYAISKLIDSLIDLYASVTGETKLAKE